MSGSLPAPCVVLLDIDGTLIGSITPSVCEYEILSACEPRKVGAFKRDLCVRLKYGTLRPHVGAFCKTVISRGSSVFVYTASDDEWAKVLVPCLEAAIGVKFQRPIFARSSCVRGSQGEYRKSVEKVAPAILRALKKAGRADATLTKDGLASRVTLVDNTPGILTGRSSAKQVLCPTYAYTYVYDVLRHLSIELLHARFHQVEGVLKRHGMLPMKVHVDSQMYHQFIAEYYAHLATLMRACHDANVRALRKDTFFAHLADAILR